MNGSRVSGAMLRERPAERARPAVRAEPLTTPSALEALRPEWERLWAQDTRATPFQSPAWLLPWWKHVGAGQQASLALRCATSGELVGLAPLYLHIDAATGRRHLFPIGIATTDVLDLLAKPGWEDLVAHAVLAQLDAAETDLLEFPQLRGDAPLLRAVPPPGWRCELGGSTPHPVLPLQGTNASPLPRAMAANLRTARHRAERMGSLGFEQADADSLPPMLAALERLHAARWSERGQAGVLADARVQAWHREATALLQAAGLLRLHALRLRGEPAAVLYCLADPPWHPQRRCYYYIGGFEPRFAACSPGSLLIAHVIAQARQEGITAFDFLRGAEAYKYRWGACDQPMQMLRVLRA
jgi:CelD/BcsL family acetyltransferase involved in cellulose biosynthesis